MSTTLCVLKAKRTIYIANVMVECLRVCYVLNVFIVVPIGLFCCSYFCVECFEQRCSDIDDGLCQHLCLQWPCGNLLSGFDATVQEGPGGREIRRTITQQI